MKIVIAALIATTIPQTTAIPSGAAAAVRRGRSVSEPAHNEAAWNGMPSWVRSGGRRRRTKKADKKNKLVIPGVGKKGQAFVEEAACECAEENCVDFETCVTSLGDQAFEPILPFLGLFIPPGEFPFHCCFSPDACWMCNECNRERIRTCFIGNAATGAPPICGDEEFCIAEYGENHPCCESAVDCLDCCIDGNYEDTMDDIDFDIP